MLLPRCWHWRSGQDVYSEPSPVCTGKAELISARGERVQHDAPSNSNHVLFCWKSALICIIAQMLRILQNYKEHSPDHFSSDFPPAVIMMPILRWYRCFLSHDTAHIFAVFYPSEVEQVHTFSMTFTSAHYTELAWTYLHFTFDYWDLPDIICWLFQGHH